MSKYTLRKSIDKAFTNKLVNNFIISQQEGRLETYLKAQRVAEEEGDIEEFEKIEKKISEVLLSLGQITDKI